MQKSVLSWGKEKEIAELHPQSFWVGLGWDPRICIFLNCQMMLMLLVRRLNSGNHSLDSIMINTLNRETHKVLPSFWVFLNITEPMVLRMNWYFWILCDFLSLIYFTFLYQKILYPALPTLYSQHCVISYWFYTYLIENYQHSESWLLSGCHNPQVFGVG